MKPIAETPKPRAAAIQPRQLALGQQPKTIRPADMEFPPFVGSCDGAELLDRRGAPISECIPDQLENQTTIISTCQAPLSAVLELLIKKMGGCDELIISTWAASGEDVSNIYQLLAAAEVQTAKFIVDPLFSRNAPTAAKMIIDRFGGKSLVICQNHAKFAIVRRDGVTVLVRTSMNLDATPGIEYCTFDTGPIAVHVANHANQLFAAIPLRVRPEYDGDRQQQRKAAAVAMLRQVPAVGDAWFLSGGEFSFIDLIEAAHDRQPGSILLSSWIASIDHIDRLAAIKADTRLVFDKGIRKIKGGDRYARMLEQFGKSNIRLTATHAKFAIVGDCAIVTSANLNDNPRNEDFRLSWCPAVVEGLRRLHGDKPNA